MTPRRPLHPAWPTAALGGAMLLGALGTSIANIALPDIATALSVPVGRVSWVVIAYLGTMTLASVTAGRMGDRHGRKSGLLAGLVLYLAGAVGCVLAADFGMLVLARGIQGVGAALLVTLTLAAVRDALPERRLGRTLGLLGTMSAVGTALGPSLGGLLIGLAGWRGAFALLIPLGIAVLALIAATLPADRPRAHGARPPRPPLPMAALTAQAVVAATMMTTLIVGPFYLGRGLGLGPETVGFIMAAGPVLSMLAGVPSGRLVDAWGARAITALGALTLTLGAGTLALLPPALGPSGYLAAIAILTPGYQLFQAANAATVVGPAPSAVRGVLSGYLSLARNLGLIIGAWGLGALFARVAGDDPARTIQGLHASFALCALAIPVATAFTLRRA